MSASDCPGNAILANATEHLHAWFRAPGRPDKTQPSQPHPPSHQRPVDSPSPPSPCRANGALLRGDCLEVMKLLLFPRRKFRMLQLRGTVDTAIAPTVTELLARESTTHGDVYHSGIQLDDDIGLIFVIGDRTTVRRLGPGSLASVRTDPTPAHLTLRDPGFPRASLPMPASDERQAWLTRLSTCLHAIPA